MPEAMVGGNDEQRVLPLACGLQPFHQLPELVILVCHRLVVEAAAGMGVRDRVDAGLGQGC